MKSKAGLTKNDVSSEAQCILFFFYTLLKERKKKLVTLTWSTSPFKSNKCRSHLLITVSQIGTCSLADRFD